MKQLLSGHPLIFAQTGANHANNRLLTIAKAGIQIKPWN